MLMSIIENIVISNKLLPSNIYTISINYKLVFVLKKNLLNKLKIKKNEFKIIISNNFFN